MSPVGLFLFLLANFLPSSGARQVEAKPVFTSVVDTSSVTIDQDVTDDLLIIKATNEPKQVIIDGKPLRYAQPVFVEDFKIIAGSGYKRNFPIKILIPEFQAFPAGITKLTSGPDTLHQANDYRQSEAPYLAVLIRPKAIKLDGERTFIADEYVGIGGSELAVSGPNSLCNAIQTILQNPILPRQKVEDNTVDPIDWITRKVRYNEVRSYFLPHFAHDKERAELGNRNNINPEPINSLLIKASKRLDPDRGLACLLLKLVRDPATGPEIRSYVLQNQGALSTQPLPACNLVFENNLDVKGLPCLTEADVASLTRVAGNGAMNTICFFLGAHSVQEMGKYFEKLKKMQGKELEAGIRIFYEAFLMSPQYSEYNQERPVSRIGGYGDYVPQLPDLDGQYRTETQRRFMFYADFLSYCGLPGYQSAKGILYP